MHNRIFLSILILLLFCQVDTFAQTTLLQSDQDLAFYRGKELYQKEKYAAARELLQGYVKDNPDGLLTKEAEYYIAISAMNLYHKDGESKLETFIEQNPDHPKASEAYSEMGLFYFRDKKYSRAVKYLEKSDLRYLDRQIKEEIQFKTAYSYFNLKKFDKAREKFDLVKRTDSEYAAASYYYSGYISYRDGDFDQALFDFRNAEKDEAFQPVVPYMIVNMYYRQERYTDLIEYGEKVVNNPINNKNEVLLLLGDAYYIQADYENAGRNYSYYLDRNKKPLARDISYRMGYTYYKNGETEKAVERLKGLTLKNDSIGQYSGYYLGELYLTQGNKEFAAAAFLRAGQSDAKASVRDQSRFQYAKIAFESGQFTEAINYLEGLQLDEEQQSEANELLGVSYLNSSNYELALKHFENIPKNTQNTRRAYQRVTYLKASQLFNDGKFAEAVEMFKKSNQYPVDQELVFRSYYWLGETYFVGQKFEEARDHYTRVLSGGSEDIVLKARYGLGYSYYNLKEFDKARVQFRTYTNALEGASDPQFYADAMVRLGDCHYVSKEYDNALAVYSKAEKVNKSDQDYLLFQIGVIQGINGQLEEAQKSLSSVIRQYPRSRYADDAGFQYSNLDFENGNYQRAINGFDRLIKTFPRSNFVPHALLKRGIAYANSGKHDQAVSSYQQLLEKYGTHSTANAALLGLQESLAVLDRSSEFDQYLARYKSMNPDDQSLASIEFESAKSLYFNQNYSSAIRSLETYLINYPENQFSHEAKYYLADSYYRLNDRENAKIYFQQVIDANLGNRVNRSIEKIGEIELLSENYRESVRYYQLLLSRSSNKKEQYRSYEGLMHSFFRLEQFDSTALYAQKILDQGGVSTNAINEAQLFLGKAAYGNGDLETASDEFLNTLNTAKDVNGAEAQYMVAKILHDQERYELSNETLFDLNKNFGSYQEWVGEAFLLIADNYLALDEEFQAKATLQSIVDNFPDETIVRRAQDKLLDIDRQEEEEIIEQDTTEYEIIDE